MRSVIEHEHVPVMEFAEKTIDRVEIADDSGECFAARCGPLFDEVPIDDESELERVHDRMLGLNRFARGCLALLHNVAMTVVGLGAICDLSPEGNDDPREYSFIVSEFVVLDNGDRVTLHSERGFSGWSSSGSIWASATVDSITRGELTTVLAEDDEPHPWEWLADLAKQRGITVTADELRAVPYEVVLTERVRRRLGIFPNHAD
jgi:hypothetical protein